MLWKHHSDSLQASPHIMFFSTERAPKQSNYFALQLFCFEIILQLFTPPQELHHSSTILFSITDVGQICLPLFWLGVLTKQ